MTDHSIQGKTAIVAGGAKNLGGLIARDLAAHGATAIAIHYNTDASKAAADETVAAIKAAGAEAVAYHKTAAACPASPRPASPTSRILCPGYACWFRKAGG